MKATGYIFQVLLGWSLLLFLIYQYAFRQSSLIDNGLLLALLICLGTVITFLFSGLEAALLRMGDKDKKLLELEAKKVMACYKSGAITEDEYTSNHIKIFPRLMLYHEKDKLVAPLIIISNLMGVLIAASIPAALNKELKPDTLDVNLSLLSPYLNCAECTFLLPWEGTETLTFFSSAILLIMFGKVIPKKLGGLYSYQFLNFFCPLIYFVYRLFGWLGIAILATIDIPIALFSQIKKGRG